MHAAPGTFQPASPLALETLRREVETAVNAVRAALEEDIRTQRDAELTTAEPALPAWGGEVPRRDPGEGTESGRDYGRAQLR